VSSVVLIAEDSCCVRAWRAIAELPGHGAARCWPREGVWHDSVEFDDAGEFWLHADSEPYKPLRFGRPLHAAVAAAKSCPVCLSPSHLQDTWIWFLRRRYPATPIRLLEGAAARAIFAALRRGPVDGKPPFRLCLLRRTFHGLGHLAHEADPGRVCRNAAKWLADTGEHALAPFAAIAKVRFWSAPEASADRQRIYLELLDQPGQAPDSMADLWQELCSWYFKFADLPPDSAEYRARLTRAARWVDVPRVP